MEYLALHHDREAVLALPLFAEALDIISLASPLPAEALNVVSLALPPLAEALNCHLRHNLRSQTHNYAHTKPGHSPHCEGLRRTSGWRAGARLRISVQSTKRACDQPAHRDDVTGRQS